MSDVIISCTDVRLLVRDRNVIDDQIVSLSIFMKKDIKTVYRLETIDAQIPGNYIYDSLGLQPQTRSAILD